MSDPIVGGGSSISHTPQLESRRQQPDPAAVVPESPATSETGPARTRFSASQIRGALGVDAPSYSGTHTVNDNFANVQVARIKVKDHGDILENVFNFLANISIGIPSYAPCWQNGGQLDNASPVALLANAQSAAAGLRQCYEGAMTPGRHLGAGGRCLTMEIEYERTPERPGPTQSTPDTSVGPMSPVRMPDPLPQRWDLNFRGHYRPDNADFTGQMPPEVRQNASVLVRQQLAGQAGRVQVVAHSFGVQDLVDGRLVSADREVGGYDAVDRIRGNGRETLRRLEAARFVGGAMETGPNGQVTLTAESGCDIVRSGWTRSPAQGGNMREPGLSLVRSVTSRPATLGPGGQAVQITGNDLLSAARMYSGLVALNREMIGAAIMGDRALSVDQRSSRPPGEGGSLAPDLMRQVESRQISLDQAVDIAMGRQEFANVGVEIPDAITLGRRGQDGSWQALTGSDGQPIAISGEQLRTMLQSQVVPPGTQTGPSTTVSAPAPGVMSVAQLTTALGGSAPAPASGTTPPSGPNTMTVTGPGANGRQQTQTVDLGTPIENPDSDATAQTVAEHTNEPADARTLGSNAQLVDDSLAQVQQLLQQGMANMPRDQQDQIASALQTYLNAKNARAAREFAQALQSIAQGGEVGQFVQAMIARVNTSGRLHAAIDQLPGDLKVAATSQLQAAPASGSVQGQSPQGGSTSVRRTAPGGAGVEGAGRTVQAAVEEFQMVALAPRTGSGDQARLQGARTALVTTLAGSAGQQAQQTLATALGSALAGRGSETPEAVAQRLLFPNSATDVAKPQLQVEISGNQFTVRLPVTGGDPVTLVQGTLPASSATPVAHQDEPEHDADPVLVADASTVLQNPTGNLSDRFDQMWG